MDDPERLERGREQRRVEALRPYWAALANRAAAPVTHLWVGDSLTEGEGADAFGRRWVDLVLSALRSRFQPPGIPGGFGYLATSYLVTEFGGSPWIAVGAPPIAAASGIGCKSVVLDEDRQALSLEFTGTGCDVLFSGAASTGAAAVSLDGGAEAIVATATEELSQCNAHRVRGLESGRHAVRVARAGGRVVLEGAMVYDGDEAIGLRGIEFGHAGWMASDYLQTVSLQALGAAIATYTPALITLSLGTNDLVDGVSAGAFEANLATLVDAILGFCEGPTSLVLLNPYNGAGASIDHWRPYNAAVATVAAQSSGPRTPAVGIFDLGERFGDMSLDPLALTHDSTHLTNAGYQMWADALVPYLSP